MCKGVVAAVELLRVVPEAFQQSFELVAMGGVADGATAEVTIVPGDELVLEWLEYRKDG
jgi:hypothetical protein